MDGQIFETWPLSQTTYFNMPKCVGDSNYTIELFGSFFKGFGQELLHLESQKNFFKTIAMAITTYLPFAYYLVHISHLPSLFDFGRG